MITNMQQMFLFCSVTEKDINKKARNFLHLEQTSPLGNICGDKVSGIHCCPAMGNTQKITSAAKAEQLYQLYRRPEGLLHPAIHTA